MTKRMLAAVPLLCLVMAAMVGTGNAPTASPMTPSMAAPTTPATCQSPAPPAWGGCRWYCGSKSYLTQSQCQANCSSQCEQIC